MSNNHPTVTVKDSEVTQEVSGESHGIISVHAYDDTKLTSEQIEKVGNRIFEKHGKKLGDQIREGIGE